MLGGFLFSGAPQGRAGRQHHHEKSAEVFRRPLDFRDAFNIFHQAVHKLVAEFFVCLLAAPEHEGGLHAMAGFEELANVAQFGLVIVVFHVWVELHLFDALAGLMAARLFFLLRHFEFVFAEIHDSANRRLGGRRDLDKVQVIRAGFRQGFGRGNNANLATVRGQQADRRHTYLVIYANEGTNGDVLLD